MLRRRSSRCLMMVLGGLSMLASYAAYRAYLLPSLHRPSRTIQTAAVTVENEPATISSIRKETTEEAKRIGTPDSSVKRRGQLVRLGLVSRWNSSGWFPAPCNRSVPLRQISILAATGWLKLYLYNSSSEDSSVTRRAMKGWHFEKHAIGKFLNLSRDLPLIDLGANVGLVTLQAAKQGRQVVAVEPVSHNALRLCRSVLDFGHARLVHVLQNAVSSEEKKVTLGMAQPKARTMYEVQEKGKKGYGVTSVWSISMDRLLEVLPFSRAALKVDVEGHEGHVLVRADRLFREMDIPLVWMEWKHVKVRSEYGGVFIIQFMARHHMLPYNLMTGARLPADQFLQWPFSVLWRKTEDWTKA